jgi:hypothetical protein
MVVQARLQEVADQKMLVQIQVLEVAVVGMAVAEVEAVHPAYVLCVTQKVMLRQHQLQVLRQ